MLENQSHLFANSRRKQRQNQTAKYNFFSDDIFCVTKLYLGIIFLSCATHIESFLYFDDKSKGKHCLNEWSPQSLRSWWSDMGGGTATKGFDDNDIRAVLLG